jgi:UTP:GlnB (protein PII) uridylyltransferase
VIRDWNLQDQSLRLLIQQHQNKLHKQRQCNLSTPSHQNRAVWHSLWQILLAAEQALPQQLMNSHSEAYTQTIKDCIRTLCDRLLNLLGQPPRSFALVTMGSIAQEHGLPDSDIDLAVLHAAED